MTVLKAYNPANSTWEVVLVGEEGDQGQQGPPGPIGPTGPASTVPGPPGPPQNVATIPETVAGTNNTQATTPLGVATVLPFFDVRRYGAIGDGTTNDTPALAAALAAAVAAGGGNIFIPAGKTFFTDRIVLNSTMPSLRYTGGGTLKARTTSDALVRLDAITSIMEFDGIILDGNNIALSNNQSALIRAVNNTTQPVIVRGCEIKNSSQNGLSAVSGGRIIATNNNIHDCAADGVRILTTYSQIISNNYIHDCGLGGIRLQPSAAPAAVAFTEGCTVSGNTIRNMRDDLDSNGPYGNGINVWYLAGASITGNTIQNCEFSFIRLNKADHTTVTGNTGHHTDKDPGIFCEYGARYCTISGNTIEDTNTDGIAFANVVDGTVGLVANGNVIKGFGNRVGYAASGIVLSCGMAVGNYIDGLGVAGAVWALRIGTAGGIVTSEYRAQVASNQIAGTKYAVALGASSTSGTKESWITGNQVTRRDANWSGPIGMLGGSNTDGGDGSLITAAAALTMYFADNNFDVPTAQTPLPFMAGSRLKINGVLKESNGAVWFDVSPMPYTDVRSFGAKGDGTTDNTAAINAADASIAAGGVLWFPPGTYRFNTTITKSSKTVWQGVGNNPATGVTGSLLRYFGEGTAINVVGDGTTNVRGRWVGLRLTYAGANPTTTTSIGISITNTHDFFIENAYIGNFGTNVKATNSAAVYVKEAYLFGAVQDSLVFDTSSDCWVIHSQASGKRYGIYALGSSSLQLVSSRPQSSGEANVRVENTGLFGMIGGSCDSADIDTGTGAKNGMQLHNVDYVRINGVQFYANGVDADIVLSVPVGQIAQSMVFQGNVFNSGGGAKKAIRVAAVDGQLKRVAVSGNVVDNDTEPLLSIATPIAGGSVDEVTITGNVALGGFEGLPNVATVSTQGNSGWDVKPWVLKSANATLLISERKVRASPSSGNITLTLPNATYRYNGVEFVIKKTDASVNTVTIQGNGANIDGAGNMVLSTQYQSVTLEWDSNLGRWHKIATAT